MKKFILLLAVFACSLGQSQIIPADIIEIAPETVCPGDSVGAKFVFLAPVSPSMTIKVGVWMQQGNNTLFDTLYAGLASALVCVDTIQAGPVYQVKRQIPWGFPAGTWYAEANVINQTPWPVTVRPPAMCASFPSPCEGLQPIGYSVGCHTYCAAGTYEVDQSYCPWNRITPTGQCDTNSYTWHVGTSAPQTTPTIIFTPGQPGVVNFTLTGVAMIGTVTCFQSISFQFTVVACTYTNTVGMDEYSLGGQVVPIYYNLQGVRVEKQAGMLLIEKVGIRRRKIILQ